MTKGLFCGLVVAGALIAVFAIAVYFALYIVSPGPAIFLGLVAT